MTSVGSVQLRKAGERVKMIVFGIEPGPPDPNVSRLTAKHLMKRLTQKRMMC